MSVHKLLHFFSSQSSNLFLFLFFYKPLTNWLAHSSLPMRPQSYFRPFLFALKVNIPVYHLHLLTAGRIYSHCHLSEPSMSGTIVQQKFIISFQPYTKLTCPWPSSAIFFSFISWLLCKLYELKQRCWCNGGGNHGCDPSVPAPYLYPLVQLVSNLELLQPSSGLMLSLPELLTWWIF